MFIYVYILFRKASITVTDFYVFVPPRSLSCSFCWFMHFCVCTRTIGCVRHESVIRLWTHIDEHAYEDTHVHTCTYIDVLFASVTSVRFQIDVSEARSGSVVSQNDAAPALPWSLSFRNHNVAAWSSRKFV